MSDQDEPHGEGFAEAVTMLEQLEQSVREAAKAAAGTPLEANYIFAAELRLAEREGLTQGHVDAWNAPAEPAPIVEPDPGAPIDLASISCSNGLVGFGGRSADTPEDSARVKGAILAAMGCSEDDIRAMDATPPEPDGYTIDGAAPVRPATTAVVLVAPRERGAPRRREQRSGRGRTRRGPPSEDDPHSDHPAERQSQRLGRVSARDYPTTPLTWKGIGRVTLSLAGVTARHGRVRIPYRLANGAEHNARLIGGPRCWWERRGLELVPFGLEQLPSAARAARSVLFIAEGESDALMIRDQVGEHDGRTTYAIGLPGAGTWRAEWVSLAARFERVYLVPDADAAGERMARMVLDDVDWARRVCLPTGEDARSVVRAYGVGRFCSFIDQADQDAALWDAIRTADTLAEFEAMLGRTA